MESFVSAYKSLYKAISASEAKVEDFQRWFDIATSASEAIGKILTEQNLPRSKKYSLETSLGHFISIQLDLYNRIKQGGELVSESVNGLDQVSKNSAKSSPVKLNNQVNDSEVNIDHTEKHAESVKWSEINSAFKHRIKTGVITNVNHLDFNTFMNDAKVLFESQIKKVLQKFTSIKVNTTLSAKYVVLKGDSEEIDVKHLTLEILLFL